MRAFLSLVIVGALFLVGLLGAAPGTRYFFAVVLSYAAITLFLGGMIYRVLGWARVPVPFRIPTTCGQQKSLGWIKHQKLDNPHSTLGVIGRMALEVLFFRSLLRNTKSKFREDRRLVYGTDLWLWLGGMVMHWSLLVVLARHLRFFIDPVPWCVTFLGKADGFLEVGLPVFYLSSILFLVGAVYLLLRRLGSSRLRYISLVNDYFPLLMLLGIGVSGFCLRHVIKTDVVGVKEFAMGLATFAPVVPMSLSPLFFGHLTLVCVLLAYLPLSKLTHMAGVFLSPTRNLANNNRSIRHVNPWDYPVKVHAYEEYEDELRDKMKGAGIPVEIK